LIQHSFRHLLNQTDDIRTPVEVLAAGLDAFRQVGGNLQRDELFAGAVDYIADVEASVGVSPEFDVVAERFPVSRQQGVPVQLDCVGD